MSKNYLELKVSDLREECKNRNLDSTGLKVHLVERLNKFDKDIQNHENAKNVDVTNDAKTDCVIPNFDERSAVKTSVSESKERWPSPVEDSPQFKVPILIEKEIHEPDNWQTRIDVHLDFYNSDLYLTIDPSGFSAQPISDHGFEYMFAGAKANHGLRCGKVYYEVKVVKRIEIDLENDVGEAKSIKVGWSTNNNNLMLGDEPLSFGYDGSGMKWTNGVSEEYGVVVVEGDVIGCFLEFINDHFVIHYSVNGVSQGEAFSTLITELNDKFLLPHISVRNIIFEVNFGGEKEPLFPPKQTTEESLEWNLIGNIDINERIRATLPPLSKSECEVLMMCGLPSCGKTTWVEKTVNNEPEKSYNVLSTNVVLDKMKVANLRKKCAGSRWDALIQYATSCLNKMMEMAVTRKRNFILDQTNVYPTAQRRRMKTFEEFTRKAIIIVPTDDEYQRRMNKVITEEGKDVPESAVLQMKENFVIPDEKNDQFKEIIFIELQRTEAEELVKQYNEDAKTKKSAEQNNKRSARDDVSSIESSNKDSERTDGEPKKSRWNDELSEAKSSRLEDKSTKNDEKSSKYWDKSPRSDGKSSGHWDKSSRSHDKSSKFEDKSSGHWDKSSRSDDKSSRSDDKSSRSDDKSSRYENKSSKYEDKSSKYEDKSSRYDDKSSRSRDHGGKGGSTSSHSSRKSDYKGGFCFAREADDTDKGGRNVDRSRSNDRRDDRYSGRSDIRSEGKNDRGMDSRRGGYNNREPRSRFGAIQNFEQPRERVNRFQDGQSSSRGRGSTGFTEGRSDTGRPNYSQDSSGYSRYTEFAPYETTTTRAVSGRDQSRYQDDTADYNYKSASGYDSAQSMPAYAAPRPSATQQQSNRGGRWDGALSFDGTPQTDSAYGREYDDRSGATRMPYGSYSDNLTSNAKGGHAEPSRFDTGYKAPVTPGSYDNTTNFSNPYSANVGASANKSDGSTRFTNPYQPNEGGPPGAAQAAIQGGRYNKPQDAAQLTNPYNNKSGPSTGTYTAPSDATQPFGNAYDQYQSYDTSSDQNMKEYYNDYYTGDGSRFADTNVQSAQFKTPVTNMYGNQSTGSFKTTPSSGGLGAPLRGALSSGGGSNAPASSYTPPARVAPSGGSGSIAGYNVPAGSYTPPARGAPSGGGGSIAGYNVPAGSYTPPARGAPSGGGSVGGYIAPASSYNPPSAGGYNSAASYNIPASGSYASGPAGAYDTQSRGAYSTTTSAAGNALAATGYGKSSGSYDPYSVAAYNTQTGVPSYNTQSNAAYNTQSNAAYNTQPSGAYNTQTGAAYNTPPSAAYNTQTGAAYNTQTGAAYNTQPSAAYNTQTGAAYNTQPNAAYNKTAVAYGNTVSASSGTYNNPTASNPMSSGITNPYNNRSESSSLGGYDYYGQAMAATTKPTSDSKPTVSSAYGDYSQYSGQY